MESMKCCCVGLYHCRSCIPAITIPDRYRQVTTGYTDFLSFVIGQVGKPNSAQLSSADTLGDLQCLVGIRLITGV